MKAHRPTFVRSALLTASSLFALMLASPAAATVPVGSVPVFDTDIVTNDTVTPGIGDPATGANYANSPDVLSTGINGIGQMITVDQVSPTAAFLGLCSGTLINPRTVITAAHCVNDVPAYYYGSNTGGGGGLTGSLGLGSTNGVPISFGFSSTNRCRGVAINGCAVGTGPYETWRDSGFQTQTDLAIYNGNQVWYHPASVTEFGLADIAIVTLDTHARGIPTWTLLFSPLDGPTHATITGYGSSGVGTSGIGDLAGIDYRRRSAENMIDALMSSYDWLSSPAIFGPGGAAGFAIYQHSQYWYDFDDPNFDPNNLPDTFFNPDPDAPRDNGYYDFNGLGGTALPFEGATAGGDSGGPLIVDQRWDTAVVAGVLTGSWSFGGNTNYGEFSIYPPLFLYWEQIVQNNPYVYASAIAGDADWFNPTHWVQDMDPNYAVIGADGELVNSLPDVHQLNQDSTAGRFGTPCFLGFSCSDIVGSAYPTGDGTYVVTAGGPGSTNFVPNNVEPVNSPNPAVFRRARYYDVMLSENGTTTLGGNATIDKLTMEGAARLNITGSGRLNVWAEFNQLSGWTNIDGKLTTDEALVVSGLLSGKGVFNPTFLTVVGGMVAPGGAGLGTLTVQGDVILASASALLIDFQRGLADQLRVLGDADNAGILTLGSGSLVMSRVVSAPAPRFGDRFVVASAQGGLQGTFGSASVLGGVLTPIVSYGADRVTVTLGAASLAALVSGGNQTSLAFANALDQLRGSSYNQLWNLYGAVDWMNGAQLSATLQGLAPSIVGDTQLLQDRQSRQLLGTVGDRLSLLGTGQASGIYLSGNPLTAMTLNASNSSVSARLGLSSRGETVRLPMAHGITGFVSAGGENVRTSYGDTRQIGSGQRGRHFASGIEAPVGDVFVGSAIGYAEADTRANADGAKSKVMQAAAYVSKPLGNGAYVGGIIAAERASTETRRIGTDGQSQLSLTGASHSSRYTATAEAGIRKEIGAGLALTPRAQIGFTRYSMRGFDERGGETALRLDDVTVNRLESRFGAKLDGTTTLGGWSVRPQVQADYVRLLSGANNGMTVRFAGAPEYGISLPLTNGGSGWLEVKGGVELSRGAVSLGLSGQATAGDAPISDQRGAIDFTYRF